MAADGALHRVAGKVAVADAGAHLVAEEALLVEHVERLPAPQAAALRAGS